MKWEVNFKNSPTRCMWQNQSITWKVFNQNFWRIQVKSKKHLAVKVGKPIKDPKNPMHGFKSWSSKNSFALPQS